MSSSANLGATATMARVGAYLATTIGLIGFCFILVGGGLIAAFVQLITLGDPLDIYPLGWRGAAAISLAIGVAGVVAFKRPLPAGWALVGLAVIGMIFGGPFLMLVCVFAAVGGLLCILGTRQRRS